MLERTTGIEPASSAWEADILPMNYVRACICLASVLPTPAARPLKCHALKRCTFWRETCLASAIALRLVNQRARAANQRARAANRSAKYISPDAERLRLRLTARRSPSLGHLSCICSAFAVAPQSQCQVHYTLKSDFRKVPIGESAGFRGIGDEAASGRRPKAVWKVFKNALFAA